MVDKGILNICIKRMRSVLTDMEVDIDTPTEPNAQVIEFNMQSLEKQIDELRLLLRP